MGSKKSKEESQRVEDELAEKEEQASSVMRLAMDTLDRGLDAVRATHKTAKRLRASVEALDLPVRPHLVASKK